MKTVSSVVGLLTMAAGLWLYSIPLCLTITGAVVFAQSEWSQAKGRIKG